MFNTAHICSFWAALHLSYKPQRKDQASGEDGNPDENPSYQEGATFFPSQNIFTHLQLSVARTNPAARMCQSTRLRLFSEQVIAQNVIFLDSDHFKSISFSFGRVFTVLLTNHLGAKSRSDQVVTLYHQSIT